MAITEMEATKTSERAEGRVVNVIGPVVDVEFPPEHLPEIDFAIEITRETNEGSDTIVAEVSQHIGANIVKAICMQPTDGLRRGALVKNTGQAIDVPVASETLGVRLRVALAGLTMAEYFRDVQRQDVLLFIDNIFRFTQAGSEVSTLLGRMPSAVGYQPTLAGEMGLLQERITSTKGRSITSMQAVYVPADDYTDPAPHTTFAHLDAITGPHR